MKKYEFSVIFRMLLHYWKAHFSIMAQITAGIAVVYAAIVMFYSIQAYHDKTLEEINQMTWDVFAYPHLSAESPPLSYEQYKQLKQTYSAASFPMYAVHKVHYPLETGELETGLILYATDDYIEFAFGVKQIGFEQGDMGHAGEKIMAVMQENKTLINASPLTPEYSLKEKKIWIDTQVSTVLEPMPDSYYNARTPNLHDVSPDHMAILPFRAYYEIFNPADASSFRLVIKVDETIVGQQATDLIMQVLDELLSWNGKEYAYDVNSALQKLLLSVSRIKDASVTALSLAIICLLIVSVGLTGLIHALFQRRKRNIAISIALGAKRKVLFRGMMLEAVIPSLLGGVLGTLCCAYYLHTFIHFVFEIIQPVYIMIFSIVLSVLPGLFSSVTLLFRMRTLQPIEILNRE